MVVCSLLYSYIMLSKVTILAIVCNITITVYVTGTNLVVGMVQFNALGVWECYLKY